MSAVPVSVKATNSQDGDQRVWALFVDTPPGTYRGSGTWDAGVPTYETLARSDDTWNPQVDLPDGNHDLYFVVSSPDTGLGQYSGTITIAGVPHDFSGVSADASAKITVTVQAGQQTVIDGVPIQAPPGTTDVFVMKLANPGGIIPVTTYFQQNLIEAIIQFQGYYITGTQIITTNSDPLNLSEDLLIFVHSPTGGAIPASVSESMGKIFVLVLILAVVYVISYTVVDYINGQVQISSNATQVTNAVLNDTTLTPAQKDAYINAIAPYVGGGGGGGGGLGAIPGWALGIGVAVGAGVAGYLAYNIISNQPRRPKWATSTTPQATEP